MPTAYASSIANEKRVEELRIALSSGNVKDFTIEPPATPQPERIPVTDAHRRGVTDPMTAGACPRARHRRPGVGGSLPAHDPGV